MSNVLGPADLERAQAFCQVLLSKAVNNEHGRDEGDKFYKLVTENRDGPTAKLAAKYSSCADLAHWLLRSLGARATWLNRNDDGDAQPWKSGVNLNWLVPPPIGKCPIALPHLTIAPEPGDVFVENNAYGGHVFVCIRYIPETDTLISAEYGQPGGKRKERRLFTVTFNKRALSHIRLRSVLEICEAPIDVSQVLDWTDGDSIAGFRGEVPWRP